MIRPEIPGQESEDGEEKAARDGLRSVSDHGW